MIRIRPLGQQDLPFLAAWMPTSALETVPAEERLRLDPQALRESVNQMLQLLFSTPAAGFSLIAEAGGQQVGYLLGGPSPDGTTTEMQGYLMDLFVLPGLRRRGIGRSLLGQALAQFKAAGLRKAKMWGLVQNSSAIKLAAGMGFQPEGLIGLKRW